MKLIIDVNLSPSWAGYLSDAGHDAVHWSAIGPLDAADVEILAHARVEGAVILSHDLDFGAILAASRGDAPSVVQIRSGNLSLKSIGSQIIAALRMAEHELEQGALVTVEPGRTRLSMLPLKAR